MARRFDPEFEYAHRPALWTWSATLVLGAVVVFLFRRPAWLLPSAFVAGGVAAVRGDLYDQSANDAFVGVLLGTMSLHPVIASYRLVVRSEFDALGDALFFAAALSAADLLVYGPLMLVLGYLGGVFVDYLRRRIGGPVGY